MSLGSRKPLEDLREGAEEKDDGGAPHNMDIRERRVLDVFCKQTDCKKEILIDNCVVKKR